MTQPLTEQQLADIEARSTAATPGPWTVELEQCDCQDGLCSHGTYVSAVYADEERRTEFSDFTDADWQFVIRARTEVPVLLAEIRRLQTEPAQPTRRVLTPNEHDRAWHAVEGAAGTPGADPDTILNAVLHALRIEAPTAEDEQARCGKCRQHFDPADTRFDGHARYANTPYCRGCVDRCIDNESADHRCVICG